MGKQLAINETILIAAPVEKVFQYAADCRNDIHWRAGVVSYALSGADPFVVGVQSREVMRSFGRNVVTTGEMTAIEPNKRTRFHSLTGPIPVEVIRTFEQVDGGTQFSYIVRGELDTFYSLIWPLVGSSFHRQVAESLGRLKELLEESA